jgi:thiol-disulfide isomerase/thioredoxin
VISAGRAAAYQSEAGAVLLQRDEEVSKAYRVATTPSALLVRSDGRVASRVVSGAQAVQALVAQAVNGAGEDLPPSEPIPDPPKLGDAAPDFTLAGLSGRPVPLSGFRGKEIVLIFWSPSCGFCQKMLPDLKAWEADPPCDAPQVLLVSSGTVDANREMGLRSPIVLQDDFQGGRLFGADGTPSAILLDAEGKVDSELVVGATDVLGLLRLT